MSNWPEISSPWGIHLTRCQPDPTSDLTKCQPSPTSHLIKGQTGLKSHLHGAYIWPNVNLTLHLTWPNIKLALSIIFMGVFMWLGSGWHFVRWPVSQPTATGQPTRHLKKCQPNPKSDHHGSVRLTFCEMASLPTSHPAAIGQPTRHLTKCQPNPKADLWSGHLYHQYTSDILSDGQLAGQPAIWQNVNLTQSQILGEGQVDI